ncbi:MAG: hypothetical protein HKM04_03620 [Legionellales bacterium]|nr:hypothetical protein [Legionellales bacterium]
MKKNLNKNGKLFFFYNETYNDSAIRLLRSLIDFDDNFSIVSRDVYECEFKFVADLPIPKDKPVNDIMSEFEKNKKTVLKNKGNNNNLKLEVKKSTNTKNETKITKENKEKIIIDQKNKNEVKVKEVTAALSNNLILSDSKQSKTKKTPVPKSKKTKKHHSRTADKKNASSKKTEQKKMEAPQPVIDVETTNISDNEILTTTNKEVENKQIHQTVSIKEKLMNRVITPIKKQLDKLANLPKESGDQFLTDTNSLLNATTEKLNNERKAENHILKKSQSTLNLENKSQKQSDLRKTMFTKTISQKQLVMKNPDNQMLNNKGTKNNRNQLTAKISIIKEEKNTNLHSNRLTKSDSLSCINQFFKSEKTSEKKKTIQEIHSNEQIIIPGNTKNDQQNTEFDGFSYNNKKSNMIRSYSSQDFMSINKSFNNKTEYRSFNHTDKGKRYFWQSYLLPDYVEKLAYQPHIGLFQAPIRLQVDLLQFQLSIDGSTHYSDWYELRLISQNPNTVTQNYWLDPLFLLYKPVECLMNYDAHMVKLEPDGHKVLKDYRPSKKMVKAVFEHYYNRDILYRIVDKGQFIPEKHAFKRPDEILPPVLLVI